MGRRTLNILLSFAQFEREVTAERIRDKIDASKKKGIWMGAPIPLGYKSIDKKLVPVDEEACAVLTIFKTYLKCSGIQELKSVINSMGFRPKNFRSKEYTASSLNYILKNEMYIGRLPHKGANFKGEHKAIVPLALWEKVQHKLKVTQIPRKSKKSQGYPSLLTGLLYDESGNKLTPSHTNKKGTRYRYYITLISHEPTPVKRYSSSMVEGSVKEGIIQMLTNSTKNADVRHADTIQYLIWAQTLSSGTPSEQQELVKNLVKKVIIHPSDVSIYLKQEINGSKAELTIPLIKKALHSSPAKGPNYDEKLFNLIANAYTWLADLKSGNFTTIAELACYHNVDKSDMSRNIRLAFLAPDIVTAICEGTQPTSLRPTYLRRLKVIPECWDDQRKLLGFL